MAKRDREPIVHRECGRATPNAVGLPGASPSDARLRMDHQIVLIPESRSRSSFSSNEIVHSGALPKVGPREVVKAAAVASRPTCSPAVCAHPCPDNRRPSIGVPYASRHCTG
jgi:hypothetical protein